MSDTGGTCEYVLDPDDPETWGGKEGDACFIRDDILNEEAVWTCPHNVNGEGHLCIFHQNIDKKDGKDVEKKFFETIEKVSDMDDAEARSRMTEYLGATFEGLDLSKKNEDFENISDWVDLHCSEFNSEVTTKGEVIDLPLNFMNAEFFGELKLENSRFKKPLRFRDAIFRQEVNFESSTLNYGPDFSGCSFYDEISFANTTLGTKGGNSNFSYTHMMKSAKFSEVIFHSSALFTQSVFEGAVLFEWSTFNENAVFQSSHLEGTASFPHSEFHQKAHFEKMKVGGKPDFRDVVFDGETDFSETSLTDADFRSVNLTNSDFSNSVLRGANFESSILSRAILFSADLRGVFLSGAILGDIRINDETKFLGHPYFDEDTSTHTFSAIRSQPKCVYDPDYEEDNEHTDGDKAKSIYRALEELGGKHARPRLQARCFVRRQDLQKQDYWDDATADDAALEEQLIAGLRWSRTKLARATILYGESPWRVIAWSLGIIFSFALLYPLGGWMKPADGNPITYAQIASNPAEIFNSVYYSTLTYTALGFGDFQPIGLGRLLTTVETGLGAVMLALLVFILGRRAAR